MRKTLTCLVMTAIPVVTLSTAADAAPVAPPRKVPPLVRPADQVGREASILAEVHEEGTFDAVHGAVVTVYFDGLLVASERVTLYSSGFTPEMMMLFGAREYTITVTLPDGWESVDSPFRQVDLAESAEQNVPLLVEFTARRIVEPRSPRQERPRVEAEQPDPPTVTIEVPKSEAQEAEELLRRLVIDEDGRVYDPATGEYLDEQEPEPQPEPEPGAGVDMPGFDDGVVVRKGSIVIPPPDEDDPLPEWPLPDGTQVLDDGTVVIPPPGDDDPLPEWPIPDDAEIVEEDRVIRVSTGPLAPLPPMAQPDEVVVMPFGEFGVILPPGEDDPLPETVLPDGSQTLEDGTILIPLVDEVPAVEPTPDEPTEDDLTKDLPPMIGPII